MKQIISHNGSLLKKATVTLSTKEFPETIFYDLGFKFESCIFFEGGESDVLNRYDTLAEADAGHYFLAEAHHLNKGVGWVDVS